MKKILRLQQLPFSTLEMILGSGSSVQCTGYEGDATTVPIGGSGCSVQCGSAFGLS